MRLQQIRLNGVLVTLVLMGLVGLLVWVVSLDELIGLPMEGWAKLLEWFSTALMVTPTMGALGGALAILVCVLALGSRWVWRTQQVRNQRQRETALAQAIVRARQELEHETDVLLHGVIKARISELRQRVAQIRPLVPDPQSVLGMHVARLEATLTVFLDETIHLYDRSVERSGVSGSLFPGHLEQTAVRQQRLVQELGVRCTLTRAGVAPAQLPIAVEGTLELALCNAVTNAREHAQAQNISIHLAYGLTDITIQISDDGQGFTPRYEQGRMGGRGLRDVQVAVADIGGQLTVQSAPHQGTTITVVVPLPRPQLGWASVGCVVHSAEGRHMSTLPKDQPGAFVYHEEPEDKGVDITGERPPWLIDTEKEVLS